MSKNCASVALLSALLVTVANAEPIQSGTASYRYYNGFVTRLFPGTPFNPTSDPIDLQVDTEGVFVEEWQTQTGDSIEIEVVSISATGNLAGVPFQILGGIRVTPELGSFGGTLSNVVQDPNDPGFSTGSPSSLVSAQRVAAGRFAQVFADGTFAYGATPYEFESTIDSLPYSVGSEFVGTSTSLVPVHVRIGDTPNPATDPQIGFVLPGGVVRILPVPEPSGFLLLLIAVIASLAAQRQA